MNIGSSLLDIGYSIALSRLNITLLRLLCLLWLTLLNSDS